MKRSAVALAFAALAIGAAPAGAARPATAEETAQIARDLKLRPECTVATISEATGDGSLFARIVFADTDGCPTGDGFLTADNAATYPGSWLEGFSANADGLPSCEVYEVPAAVGRDLGVCDPRPAKTYFSALNGLEYKPKRFSQGAHGVYMGLRWQRWTRTVAVGRGTLDYADAYERFRVPVRVRLYRVRFCGDGSRYFTRRKVTAVHVRDRRRIAFDTRYKAAPGCPAENASP
jgi:hypothetical protein